MPALSPGKKKFRRMVMIKSLFAFMLTAVAVAAMAQSPSLRMSSQSGSADISSRQKMSLPGPPSICHPCLFYGGDINGDDPNAESLADGNTLLAPDTETLGAVIVPEGRQVVVNGLFFNLVTTSVSDNLFDPKMATWEIRTGVSEGNGGTQVASGSGNINPTLSGRNPFGLTEYTVAVAVIPPATLTAGTYWVNVSPQCTNSSHANCYGVEYYVDNTTQETNSVRGYLQPPNQIFFNSAYYGFTWANWCDASLDLPPGGCQRISFGVIGTLN
jgi:hypothetical protein